MHRDLERLTSTSFDLLVVGGGIYGLTAAYDAAQRGLEVALIDRGDFGAAASFNHLKTAHGGLRSLQTGNLRQARASVRERRTLARIAPHLVRPLPFLVPTTRQPTRSRLALRGAFWVDALVGHDRNDGVQPQLHLPAGRLVSRDECQARFGPLACGRGVTGGALWYDYQLSRADRLTIAFALAAAAAGACLANYVEASDVLVRDHRAVGVRGRDVASGDSFDISAAVTLNAAGAGAGGLGAKLGASGPFPLQKAMNLVVHRPMSDPSLGASVPGAGLLLLIPWRGRTMVGTWHAAQPAGPHDTAVTEQEVEQFITDANRAFPGLDLDVDEVTLVHRGLVPADRLGSGAVSQARRTRILDHASDGIEGAVSLLGVKYTTARGVAEDSIDLVARKLQREVGPCETGTRLLPGAEPVDIEAEVQALQLAAAGAIASDSAHHLVETYGTRARAIADLARLYPHRAARVVPSEPVIQAEILHAVRQEMARTLVDVVARRTPLGDRGHPGRAAAARCAELMAEELGWRPDHVIREVAALETFYAPVGLGDGV